MPDKLLADRDKQFGVSTPEIRKRRAKLGPVPQIDPPKSVNDLGRQLTSTFRHINSSSKLSAMALLGGRLAREVAEARVRIAGSARVLNTRKDARMAAVAAELVAVEERLARLETAFQADFDEELTVLRAAGKPQG